MSEGPKTKAITIRWPAEYFGRLEQTARRAGKPSTYGFVKDLAEQACERSERGLPIDGADLESGYSESYVTELCQRITALEDERDALVTEREGWLADTPGGGTNQPLSCPACGQPVESATHFVQTLTGALGIDEVNTVVHSCEGPAKGLYDHQPDTPTGVIPGQPEGLPQQAAPQQLPPTSNPEPDPAWQHQHEQKPLGTPENPAPVGSDSPLSVQGVPLVVDHRNDIPGGRPAAQLPPGVACTHKVAEWTDEGKRCATCGAMLAA